jgi:hypothetical protein
MDEDSAEITQLELWLQNRMRGRVRQLRLIARDGGLALQGQSRTHYAKQLAQHAIVEATPLRLVANEIQVSWDGGTTDGSL